MTETDKAASAARLIADQAQRIEHLKQENQILRLWSSVCLVQMRDWERYYPTIESNGFYRCMRVALEEIDRYHPPQDL